jgi:hypothetical protein
MDEPHSLNACQCLFIAHFYDIWSSMTMDKAQFLPRMKQLADLWHEADYQNGWWGNEISRFAPDCTEDISGERHATLDRLGYYG